MNQQAERKKGGGWFGDVWRKYFKNKIIEEDVRQTTERLVQIADPHIRQAGGYRKVLREPVMDAKSYCASLLDTVPGPVALSRDRYNDDPLVKAVFVSADQLEELLQLSPEVTSLRKGGYAGLVIALMTMSKEEKTIFGYQKEGETIMRDVAQRAVNFSDHRLIAPAADISDTKVGIVNRGLDVLATVAMEQIATLEGKKAELLQRKEYLKAAMKILSGKTSMHELFATPDPGKWEEYRKTEKLLVDVQKELEEVQKSIGYPEQSLGYLDGILRNAGDTLVMKRQTMRLNWMNVHVDNQPDEAGNDITLAEFSIYDIFSRSAMLVSFPVDRLTAS